MKKSTKIDDDITYEDLEIISQILIGCSKMILSFDNKDGIVLSDLKISKKDIVKQNIFSHALSLSEDSAITPADFRYRLPESVGKIPYSTITEILNILTQGNILKKFNPQEGSKPHNRGRTKIEKRPGVRSYYQKSQFLDQGLESMNKKQVRTVLFKSLSESGLLRKFLFYSIIEDIYKEKINPLDSINEISLAATKSKPLPISYYIKKMGGETDSAKKVIKSASDLTELILKEIDENDPLLLDLYYLGRHSYSGYGTVVK